MECYFCRRNIKNIDYKNSVTLKNFLSAAGKIKARSKTGLCAIHQRNLASAIKRARQLGIISPSSK
ncbi:MAG TPA: 30S ribosomal protein S18 [Candidatus Pacearchaeota archaeon]|nr:30S ribosomal protein S18 [Candidatus Pacearchaeota archaeon]HOU45773.1 30S ribosomal protein S18 [Candidatus Pacearchaeota archaeon]HPM08403.1 30S ribosomal protein S18 [Candidatus Pacearchaeota archaeon]HQI74502.1 30S ribosomal protein S18 [Candidatus Pacearchaeota archaeon]